MTQRLPGESRSLLWRCLAIVVLWLSMLAPRAALAAGTLDTGSSYAPPADAPSADHHGLELPARPSSYAVTDHGWIDFAYPPAARERVQPLLRDADAVRAELSVRLGQRVLDHQRL